MPRSRVRRILIMENEAAYMLRSLNLVLVNQVLGF
jgi:hypothetical protein